MQSIGHLEWSKPLRRAEGREKKVYPSAMSKIWQDQGSDKQQKEAKVEQKPAKRASSPRQKTLQDWQKAFTLFCVSTLTQWHTARRRVNNPNRRHIIIKLAEEAPYFHSNAAISKVLKYFPLMTKGHCHSYDERLTF
jgi:hypothetical protein